MKTVHLVGNAHLDPVWLWRRSEGIDAVLATARSACDRLDECPEFVFTCSGSWFHGQIERIDPPLFERVRRFVGEGRWQLVGGMVIQPDCNLPSAESFARQLATGQDYYRRAFGRTTTVGYNVDSFGHTAYLPRFLREAGIDAYCFMRPGPHERDLPGALFRWRSPDEHEVAAFRIVGPYCTHAADIRAHVQAAIEATPEGVDHTMCFFGVGDHGGGPTREQIAWLRENADAFAGARLVFSHPRAFFDAVAGCMDVMPVVTGELQHHAIGCYSVERRIKVPMRRAESRLVQAARTAALLPGAAPADAADTLARAWDAVLFNQFHDMLDGTCLDEASAAVAGELAAAEAAADDLLTRITRRAFRDRARPGEHQVVLVNPSPEAFDGYVAHEPWQPPEPLLVLDERGAAVPHQRIERRAKCGGGRVLVRVAIGAGGTRVLRLVRAEEDVAAPPAPAGTLSMDESQLANDRLAVQVAPDGLYLGDWVVSLDVHDDPSDTWSHSCGNRFDGARLGSFKWAHGWQAVESGPLRAALRGRGEFGHSRVWCRAMVTRGEPTLHLRLSVVWAQAQRLLRLHLAAPERLLRRTDLVSGGPLVRPIDGQEYPLSGALAVADSRRHFAVVAPEVFSVSVDPEGVSLTLLRSPFSAHHDPFPAEERPDHHVTDQGWHDFDVVLWPDAPADLAEPAHLARQMLMPPITWDLTG